jgi:hypothetical protein
MLWGAPDNFMEIVMISQPSAKTSGSNWQDVAK